MDRLTNYPGQIPLETDLLNTNRNVLIALGVMAKDLFGAATVAGGLLCTASAPAAMTVSVGAGSIYSLQNIDNSAYSSLAADTAHQIVKQGIVLDPTTLACAAPVTAGFSVNYLVQAAYSDVDDTAVVLPYYNSANPTQAYSGPANTGAPQSTARRGAISLNAKAGIAASTGTQLTPAADTGYVGLWVVTVNYGQTSITSANIALAPAAPFLTNIAGVLADPTSSSNGASRVALYSGAAQAYWNAANMYALALEQGSIVNPVKGADKTGAIDATPAFNAAISRCSLAGGGTVRPAPGVYLITGSVLLPNDVCLDLTGVALSGSGIGTNTLIKTGAIVGGVLVDITTQYGTLAQGAGTNFSSGRVKSGHLRNAACGIRGHRMNYGARIDAVTFEATLTNAWITTHSWGLWVGGNTAYTPAIMKDFVDWTTVINNSFEGQSSAINATGLTITTGGWGGSYSLTLQGNGFHHWNTGVYFGAETYNTKILTNHFEDTVNLVAGNASTMQNWELRGNWWKANLATPGAVTALNLPGLANSIIGPNTLETDGESTFAAYYVLNANGNIGNEVWIPYSPSGGLPSDWALYQIGDANEVVMWSGSASSATSQPQTWPMSGSTGYTREKYRSTYHAVANQIPNCTVTYSGTTATIDTWIVADATGTDQFCAFNLKCNATATYRMAGTFCGLDVVFTEAKDRNAGTTFPGTVVLSNNGGILRITITGLVAGGNVTGWVKEL